MEYSQLLHINNSVNIVIYGAGTLGRIIYHELLKNINIRVLAWSDQNYDRINDAPIEIINPKNINNYPFDFIILAFNNKSINYDLINKDIYNKIIKLSKEENLYIIKKEIEYTLIYDDFARKCFIERLLDENVELCKLKAEIYKFFIYGSRIRYWNNSIEQRNWYMGNHTDIAYLSIAKCACTSIINSLINEKMDNIHSYAESKYKICGTVLESTSIFKFTYVRNPFERLVSCFVDKIANDEKDNPFEKYNYCMGILNSIKNFDDFVKCIVSIPDRWADRHFKSQHSYIYENEKKLVDYIGKVEDLPNDYNFIQKKYNLNCIDHMNKSKKYDWKSYYTKETANLVYEYYKKDILIFGYEPVYFELLEFLNNI